MRKPAFCICENKDAVTAKLISTFVFATLIVLSLYFLSFVSDLVGNPEDRFSHNEALIIVM